MSYVNFRGGHDVSILIPSYNYGAYIDQTLRNIYSQDNINSEIIVVDDGSTDNTRDVILRHKGKVKYVYQDNQGVSAARNKAIENCSSDYVLFLDSDDLLGHNTVSKQIANLNRHDDSGVSICKNHIFDRCIFGGYKRPVGWWGTPKKRLKEYLCRANIAPPHAFLLPRRIVDSVGGFDESLGGCEDYDYWLKILGGGYAFYYCSNAKVYYRKHVGSRQLTKNLNGSFEYDVLVQKRKHSSCYGNGVGDLVRTLDGSLAFADGLVTVALKIDPRKNASGKREMADLAAAYLGVFIGQSPSVYSDLSVFGRTQVMRLLSKQQVVLDQGMKELWHLIEQIRLSYSGIGIRVRNVLASMPLDSFDKKLLFYFTLKPGV